LCGIGLIQVADDLVEIIFELLVEFALEQGISSLVFLGLEIGLVCGELVPLPPELVEMGNILRERFGEIHIFLGFVGLCYGLS